MNVLSKSIAPEKLTDPKHKAPEALRTQMDVLNM